MATWDGASILVIRLSSLGDVARLLPSLAALKASGASRVDLAVEDRFAGLLDLFPIPDSVLPYPRRDVGPAWRDPFTWFTTLNAYLGVLRSRRYDLALDLHGIFRSALLAGLSGAKETAGFAKGFGKEFSHLLYDRKVVPAPSPRISRYERYGGTLRALGFPGPSESYLTPTVPGGAAAAVAAFLEEHGLTGDPYLFSFLGTSRTQAHKRWPAKNFVELSRVASARWGMKTVVGWGPEEAELVGGLPAGGDLLPIPDWGLPELLEVIRRSRAFVGADTGAMHLAALMGVPTVALLGPTDPVLNRPFGVKVRVVYREGIRRACPGEGCSHGDCMAALGVGEVVSALGELLEDPR
jgi:heptosyltransferase I